MTIFDLPSFTCGVFLLMHLWEALGPAWGCAGFLRVEFERSAAVVDHFSQVSWELWSQQAKATLFSFSASRFPSAKPMPFTLYVIDQNSQDLEVDSGKRLTNLPAAGLQKRAV